MYRWRQLISRAVVTAVLALGLGLFYPVGRAKPFRQPVFEDVVAQIKQGRLEPDARGVVVLPTQWRDVSATGMVYVSRPPEGGWVIFFPARVGRNTLLVNPADVSGDNWLDGYLYDSEPGTREPSAQESGEGSWAEALGPPPAPPWRAAHNTLAIPRNLCNRQRLTAHWFYADIFS